MKLDKKEKVNELLSKYRSGICSSKELKELLYMIEEDEGLYVLLDKTVNHDWSIQALSEKDNSAEVSKSIASKNVFNRSSIWRVAAGVAILVVAGFLWWFTTGTSEIYYYTDFGERQTIELPDGSQVTLNANSELMWNKNWKRTGVRSVILNGEAYFDVVKYNSQKFEVNTGDVVVKVLGTSFNVSKRRGDTEVFLQEGKVELELPGLKDLAMIPGDKIEYKSDSRKVKKSEKETLHSAAAWKTGVISFHKQPLEKIIPELCDIYGIELTCMDDSLNHKVMDVGVPYMDWDATKQSLELAMKVVILEEGGKYYIENIE